MRTLRTLAALSLSASTFLLTVPSALACGGPFGPGVEVEPAQTIIVSHIAGVERYEFNPRFCGKGAEFGLILPVPSPLEGNPVLGQAALRDELEDLSKPEVVRSESRYCPSRGPDGGAGGKGLGMTGNGVDVINAGTVGFLDFTLLKADSETSLTAFLDANKYPYDDKSKTSFTHYVKKGWYFVAFKVAAGDAPPEGKRLCGDLGPIALSFKTPEPVIPTRILFDNRVYLWRIYSISEENRGPNPKAVGYGGALYFAGGLTQESLSTRPSLAAVAQAGQRVTRHDVSFSAQNVQDDLTLTVTASPAVDFRSIKYETTQIPDSSLCGGGGGKASGKGGTSAAGAGGTSPVGAGGSSPVGAGGVFSGGASAAAPPGRSETGGGGCTAGRGGTQGLLAGLAIGLAALLARRRRG